MQCNIAPDTSSPPWRCFQTRKVLLGARQLNPADVKKCNTSLHLLNTFLSEADYLAGDQITMVDYTVAAVICGCQTGTINISSHPHTQRWFSRVSREIEGFDEINEPAVQIMSAFMSNVTLPDDSQSKL